MATRPLNILICDDSDDDRFFFKEALRGVSLSYKLEAVNNGEELMQYLHNNKNLPDLIFLDLNMPRKNGFECLKEMKESEVFKTIPVIILSTTNYSKTIDDTYQAGAFLYMIKPSSIVVLKNEIEKALFKMRDNPSKKTPRSQFVLTEEVNS